MGYEVVSQGIVSGVPQSVINVRLQTMRTNANTTTYKQSASTTMSIDGSSSSKTINYNVANYSVDSWGTVWTKLDVTITHSTSTGQKTISLAFNIDLSGTSASSASHTWTGLSLPTIPMGSTLALDASSYTISDATGPTATATITRYNNDYYHQLVWKLGTTTIATQNAGKVASATKTLAAADWLPHMTTSVSASGSCTLKTYSDSGYSTQVGVDSTVNFSVICNRTPTIGTLTTSTVGGISSVWIGGYTKGKLTVSSTSGINGSSVTKWEYLLDGVVQATYTSSTLNWTTTNTLTAGSHTLSIRITDSRGKTASKSSSVTVQAYATPKISSVSIFRCDSGGTKSEEGTYISVKGTATATPAGNSITSFKVYTKASNSNTYTDKGSLTNGTASIISSYAYTSSWNVKLEATDAVGNTSTYVTTVPTATYTMDFKVGGAGVSFGKVAENNNQVDSAWQIRSQKTGSGANAAFFAQNGTASTETAIGLKRTDTNRHIQLLIGSNGINRGLACNDGNMNDYLMYYNDTNLIIKKPISSSQTNAWSGENVYSGTVRVKNSPDYPAIFFSSNDGLSNNRGFLEAGFAQTNGIYRFNRLHFGGISYNSSTGEPLSYYEQYRLPIITADRTASVSYDILTTKSAVTIAQGGTGQTAVSTESTTGNIITAISGGSTTPTSYTAVGKKWGKVANVAITLKNGAINGANSGSDRTVQITFASAWTPACGASAAAYWSNSAFPCELKTDSILYVRNASATSRTFTTSDPLEIYLTYLLP